MSDASAPELYFLGNVDPLDLRSTAMIKPAQDPKLTDLCHGEGRIEFNEGPDPADVQDAACPGCLGCQTHEELHEDGGVEGCALCLEEAVEGFVSGTLADAMPRARTRYQLHYSSAVIDVYFGGVFVLSVIYPQGGDLVFSEKAEERLTAMITRYVEAHRAAFQALEADRAEHGPDEELRGQRGAVRHLLIQRELLTSGQRETALAWSLPS